MRGGATPQRCTYLDNLRTMTKMVPTDYTETRNPISTEGLSCIALPSRDGGSLVRGVRSRHKTLRACSQEHEDYNSLLSTWKISADFEVGWEGILLKGPTGAPVGVHGPEGASCLKADNIGHWCIPRCAVLLVTSRW